MSDLTRNPSIDALRGIAISSIVMWHVFADDLIYNFPWLQGPVSILWSGVDLFFVLSGFLIGSILLRNVGATNFFKVFYARRALRILPLYVLLLMLVWGSFSSSKESVWPLLIFVQNIQWAVQERFGALYVGATWSLAVEEQFYLLLPAMIWLIPRRILPVVFVALILAAPAFRTALWHYGYRMPTYMMLPSRMDALFLGVLVAWLIAEDRCLALVRRHRPFLKTATLVAAIGFAALAMARLDIFAYVLVTVGYTWIAAFYALILTLTVTSSRKFPPLLRPVAWVGVGAYSIYLAHLPLAVYLSNAVNWGSRSIYLSAYVVVLLSIAAAAWWMIERPIIDWGRQRFRYSGKPVDGIHFPNPFSASRPATDRTAAITSPLVPD